MANGYWVVMNGKRIWVANFKRDGGFAFGRIHGNDVEALVGFNMTDAEARRKLVECANETYGEEKCSMQKRGKLISKSLKNRRVTESHIENLGNGVSRGVAKVDGEDVSILYTGTVMNDHGEVLGAKPWLSDFRKDAIKLKDRNKGKVFAFPDVSLVDNEFIQRLIREKNLMVKKGVVYIGSEKIKIANMKKVDAANAIKTAVERYNEETKQMETEVEKLLACF